MAKTKLTLAQWLRDHDFDFYDSDFKPEHHPEGFVVTRDPKYKPNLLVLELSNATTSLVSYSSSNPRPTTTPFSTTSQLS